MSNTLSMSKIKRVMKCYNFNYIQNFAMITGSIKHELLEKYFKQQELDTNEKVIIDKLLSKFKNELFLKNPDITMVEKELYSEPFKNDIRLHGIIDILQMKDNKALILDWKTGNYLFEPDTIQSLFYAYLVMSNYDNINEVVFTLAFTKYGITKSIIYSRTDMSMIRIECLEYIKKFIDIMDKKELRPGKHCINCENKYSCDVIPKLIANKGNDMEFLIKYYNALVKEANNIKELIEEKADKMDTEKLKELGIEYKTYERRYVKKGAVDFLKSKGYENLPVKLDLSKAKKIDQDIIKLLEDNGYIEVKKYSNIKL